MAIDFAFSLVKAKSSVVNPGGARSVVLDLVLDAKPCGFHSKATLVLFSSHYVSKQLYPVGLNKACYWW